MVALLVKGPPRVNSTPCKAPPLAFATQGKGTQGLNKDGKFLIKNYLFFLAFFSSFPQ